MTLKEYKEKRKFQKTPEPEGAEPAPAAEALRFVVHMHAATRLHYDLRIEMGGSYKSWAVPKGPTLNPTEQRLAVFVEDHPIAYGDFEGIIPKGNYGAGTVMIWDHGTYVEKTTKDRAEGEKRMLKGLDAGSLKFVLSGKKIAGEFTLVRLEKDATGKSWLLIKKRDDYARYKDDPADDPDTRSVTTGRTMKEIAAEAPSRGDVWHSKGLQPKAKKSRKAAPPPAAGGVEAEALPRKLELMLPTIKRDTDQDFAKGEWLFEERHDGVRALAFVEPGKASLRSRQGLSFDAKYPKVVKALATLGHRAVLDGEVIGAKTAAPSFVVSDLLHLDGENLRALSLADRRARLKKLAKALAAPVVLAKWGKDQAKVAGPLGVVARHVDSPYVAGTSAHWVKLPGDDAAESSKTPPPLADVPISHPDKLYWPAERRTKGDLVAYYREVAEVMAPHLQDRPHSLHRHPDGIEGEGFYQKDLSGYRPPWVDTIGLFSGGRTIQYLVCRNAATILYMANLGCIEINPWLARTSELERPDFCVIDLDPDKQSYDDVVKVALATRAVLEERELVSYVKTSGASGMHIFLPLPKDATFESSRELAESVARVVQEQLPELTTLERNPDKRKGRMYLDCWQNRRGQTLSAVYSVRPRPGAPVSTPLEWREVKKGLRPDQFTVDTVPKRLAKLGDLWAPLLQSMAP